MSSHIENEIGIYAAGGAGINIASKFVTAYNKTNLENFAKVSSCFIDTSASNLKGKNIPSEDIYLFSNLDGSGKDRASNAEVISNTALEIIEKFPPKRMNIVIHSASGGSGSVIGPSLVSELKAMNVDADVVVMLIGSRDDAQATSNSSKTLETYENIARLRKSSVVLHYLENSGSNRVTVDESMLYAISLLAGLFSGVHSEMDSADLKTWINMATRNLTTPGLTSLTFNLSQDDETDFSKVVSVATLATEGQDTIIIPTPSYQTVGFVPDHWVVGDDPDGLNLVSVDSPCHFCLCFDKIKEAHESLKEFHEQNIASLKAKSTRTATLNANPDSQPNGLVL